MSDLVERLRKVNAELVESDGAECEFTKYFREAADRIETLEAAIKSQDQFMKAYKRDTIKGMADRIETLEAALREIMAAVEDEEWDKAPQLIYEISRTALDKKP